MGRKHRSRVACCSGVEKLDSSKIAEDLLRGHLACQEWGSETLFTVQEKPGSLQTPFVKRGVDRNRVPT